MHGPSTNRARPPVDRPGIVKPQLAADWALFQDYCATHGEKPLPASPALVAAFLAGAGGGRATLPRRLAAIDHQNRQRGLPPPGLDAGVRAALRQARRAAPRPPRRAAPTSTALLRIADACRGDLAGQRDRALLLLLAAGLGRSAIVALQAEQLRFSEAGLEMNTGPSGDTPRNRHLPRSACLAACPVRAVEDWLRASATRYGPVFRKVNRWGQLEQLALGADAIRLIQARRTAALPPGRRS